MELTLMGYILIPVAILSLFLRTEYVLYLTLFFSGFTGASILDIQSITFSLQPAYFFGLIFLAKAFFCAIVRRKFVTPDGFLVFFVVISTLSLIMPFLLQGKGVMVITPDNEYKAVSFSFQNITQWAYLLYSFVIYWVSKDFVVHHPKILERSIGAFLIGATVVSLLSFYQEVAFVLNFPYDVLFRQSIHANTQPFGHFLRVSGVAQEPSMHAFFIMPIIAFLFGLPHNGIWVKHKFLLVFLLFVSGILSTSTTFAVGIFFLFVLLLHRHLFRNRLKSDNLRFLSKIFIFSILGFFIVLFAFYLNPTIKMLIVDSAINKFSGHNVSGTQRWGAFFLQIKNSLRYPLLGVGFGASRSKDLLSTWLANVGYIGVFSFLSFAAYLLYRLKKVTNISYKGWSNAYSFYFIILFLLAFISVPEPYFLFIWINLAIAESILILEKRGKSIMSPMSHAPKTGRLV